MEAQGNFVMIEPINNNDLLTSSIKGFEYKPKYQGVPTMGYVRYIGGGVKSKEFNIDDKVIFDEPQPNGFTYNGVNYIPVECDKIKGVVNET